ncbi:unnamed protein product [Amoebophrya sp. A25]|nr:unnamed protein product [Amoebophrya sp. A25]|eukprot:GSA25T00013199001.1
MCSNLVNNSIIFLQRRRLISGSGLRLRSFHHFLCFIFSLHHIYISIFRRYKQKTECYEYTRQVLHYTCIYNVENNIDDLDLPRAAQPFTCSYLVFINSLLIRSTACAFRSAMDGKVSTKGSLVRAGFATSRFVGSQRFQKETHC